MQAQSPLSRLRGTVFFCAALLPGTAPAAGPTVLAAETARFLTLFPASEMQSLERRMSVHIAASMSSRIRPDFLRCLDSAFVPGVFDDTSLTLATNTFQDAQHLKEINEFLQTDAGTTFRQNMVKAMAASLKKLQAGGEMERAAPPVYSAADMRTFQAFSLRPGYAFLNRFNEGLVAQFRTNDSDNKKVWDIHVRCSVETDNTRGETTAVPIRVK